MMWQIEVQGHVYPQRYETLEIALHKCRFTPGAIAVRKHDRLSAATPISPEVRARMREAQHRRWTKKQKAEAARVANPDYWSAVKEAASP